MALQSYQFNMRSGPTPGQIYPIQQAEIIIGRDLNADMTISDPEISRRHARLTQQSGALVLEDLGSTNGTFVNGQRLAGPRVLHPGDVIQLGENVALVFEIAQFDPDATIASAAPMDTGTAAPSLPSREAPPKQPSGAGYVEPPYSGRVPAGPVEEDDASTKEKRGLLPYVLAGCGCLMIVCIASVAVLWYIDANYLWCNVLPFLPACP